MLKKVTDNNCGFRTWT